MMKTFLRKMIIFIAPLGIILLPFIALISSHEIFINCEKIAKSKKPYVFGLAYSEVGRQFKFLNVQEKEAFHILSVGSSRVMQFRSAMFNKSFYNAGGTVQSIGEFEYFLRSLPKSKLPKIVIMGIDQWMFN
ncbi:MAG: hypothetical protein ABI477_22940, partial [Chryseolinea sp.]